MQATLQPAISAIEPTRFVELVFPEQANHYGTLFGGTALSLMGKAAFVAATVASGNPAAPHRTR